MSVAVRFDGGRLGGRLHLPPDPGPVPVVVWGHGSERLPGAQDALAEFYNRAGYALFLPHRGGHGSSAGPYAITELGPIATPENVGRLVVELHERQLDDTAAAVRWISGHPRVDSARVAVSGVSFGGVQTMLAAEARLGAKAYVAFSPGATAWDEQPLLRRRLRRAARAAADPVLVVQAANDHSLGPARELGRRCRAHVYPRYGRSAQAAHGEFGCRGMEIWGPDVLAFLGAAFAS